MLLSNAEREDLAPVAAPTLGARRLPGARLRDQHTASVELVGIATELKGRLGADSLRVAAALADSVVRVVTDVVGHDLSGHRDRFSEAGHFGGLLAAAEELQPGAEPGVCAPHVTSVLACVEAQFSDQDPLAEQLSRWLLGAGYFLVRTGQPTAPLVESLRTDLSRLLGEVEADTAQADVTVPEVPDAEPTDAAVADSPRRPARLPRPATAPEQVAHTAPASR